jgi:hypothetical protein
LFSDILGHLSGTYHVCPIRNDHDGLPTDLGV